MLGIFLTAHIIGFIINGLDQAQQVLFIFGQFSSQRFNFTNFMAQAFNELVMIPAR